MKKSLIPFFILISSLFISCNQAAFEQFPAQQGYGTVIIGIAGNSVNRAVDSDGLPIFSSSAMTIKVTKDDGTSITEKHFAESDTKSLSLTLPIGEKIVVKISVDTVSARWSGEKRHEVTSGTNTVSVKLKKAAVVLNSLLFGTDKPHTSNVKDYTLTLKIGSNEVKKEHIKYHNLCRDNKGRTYLAYNTGNQWNIERYTSEGDKEDKSFGGFMGVSPLILASDHATGKVYLAAETSSGASGNMHLYRINEDGSYTELTGSSIGYIESYAVYDNVLIALLRASVYENRELKIYRINGDQRSEITLSAQPNLRKDTGITLDTPDHYVYGEIKDFYMTKDALYLLFSAFDNQSGKYYSLGGIVKYSYSADSTTVTITDPVRIGIKDAHTPDGNGIYQTEESNFYGPVKVTGFDEENLYIADDGIKFEYQKGKPRITANKNRIATLNKGTNALTFDDAPSGITWMSENPVWTGVSTKTIVWKKNSAGHGFDYGFDYYQITQAADTLPSAAFGVGEGQTVGPDHKFTDVFCFDEAGNLYIVRNRTGGYCICRFELKDDGSYDQEPSIMTHNLSLSDSPTAIAIDISGSVKKDGQSVNALYYSYDDGDKSCIKRLTWAKNAAFSTAAEDNSFAGSSGVLEGPQDTTGSSKTKTRFTALAADKNGFYVGETFKEEDPITKKHIIKVKKYAHTAAGYTAHDSTIEVVPLTEYADAAETFSLSENLTALYIQDDVLYGVTAKEFRNDENAAGEPKKASISGKLWKIGKTDAAFTTDTLKRLHSSEPESLPVSDDKRKEGGKFAPYRFIAVKPKKMVIASDGFYGYVESDGTRKADQYNFIWTFELKTDGSTGEPNSTNKGTDVSFSNELQPTSYFNWE
ncbi:MAG: hypothetical protein ACTTI6_07010 [Treponema sp.]|uniref:hypothetical protein n=1 Tax=Treponema sp. TaxID=166 RepID=UPI003FA25227